MELYSVPAEVCCPELTQYRAEGKSKAFLFAYRAFKWLVPHRLDFEAAVATNEEIRGIENSIRQKVQLKVKSIMRKLYLDVPIEYGFKN